MSLTRVLQEHYSWTAGPAEDVDGLLLIACDCGAILGNASSSDIPARHVAHVEVYVRAWWNAPLRAIPAFMPDPALVDNVEGNDRIRRRDRAAAATPEESPTMPTLTEQERELLWEAIERACAVLHRTADLEMEIYGEIVSESVAAHCLRCFIDPRLGLLRPPRGPGAASLRHVLIAGPLPGRRE